MRTAVTPEQIRWFRFRRSGLARNQAYATTEEAASALGGIQAQILSAAALAFWNRSATGAATYEEFSTRLHDTRSLVKLWGQRHTLHIYATRDWPMVQAAFSGRLSWWEREAAQKGPPELADVYRQAIARVAVVLRERGVMGRRDLRALEESLPAALLSPWGGIFSALVREGHACHARWNEGEARYAHRSHWLPDLAWTPPTPHEGNVVLAKRYFAAYGPATLRDFAYWRGISVAEAQLILRGTEDELVEVSDIDGNRLLLNHKDFGPLAQPAPARGRWPIRLLGRFDPLLLAHKDKNWVVPADCYARVWRPAGHIEGVVLENGKAVGTWRYDRIGTKKLAVNTFPFKRWPIRVSRSVAREAKAVARFFGLQLSE